MNPRHRTLGFTLVEMVVAIAIGAVVVVFAATFIAAPIDAYEAHARRSVLVAEASTAWPRMQADLRQALPNSLRERRNGNFVVLEMLDTVGYARYSSSPAATFTVHGTTRGIFGGNPATRDFVDVHLSVNNAGQQAYTQTISMTPPLDVNSEPSGATEATLTLTPAVAPAINNNSPGNRIYLVLGPITYLCDETQGTIRRYWQYPIAASQTARDTPAEFGGAQSEVVARGVSQCNFTAPILPNRPQLVTVRLTTTRDNESVTLMHRATLENLP